MAIYKHKGKWMYDFTKNKVRNRQGGFDTKNQAIIAQAKAKENLSKINLDFIKLCESRLEDLQLRRSRQHFKENEKLIKNLIKLWGGKKQITRDDVEDYLNETARRTTAIANKELRFIKALFNHGIDREWFSYNPAGKIKDYPMSRQRKYVPPKEDLDKVIEVAKPLDRLYLLLVKNTLARISEINNLKWSDIYDSHLILRTRKAKNSDLKERRIPFNKEVVEALKQIPHNGEYLFINPRTGKNYVYRKRMMKSLCKKAKVKFFNFHSIRHYGASRLADKGASLTDIQYLLGHEKATTTSIYLHEIGASVEKAVALLGD